MHRPVVLLPHPDGPMNAVTKCWASVLRKITPGKHGDLEDMLQPGRRQVAAGYVIYGSSTMLVRSRMTPRSSSSTGCSSA